MKKQVLYAVAAGLGLLFVGGPRVLQSVQAAGPAPIVFQAAGPNIASIQSMVDAFRAALGANNLNVTGPLASGRREINWDGGGSTATSPVPTPFDGFLVTRGARFTTNGTGFVQAPVAGIATTFNNPSYATVFQAFSPVRLFSPIASRLTTGLFFIPGGGELAATTDGFGAVFSDVDANGSTVIEFFGATGNFLFSKSVPAAVGNATMSFLGVLFAGSDVASVRITTGTIAPGPNDGDRDIVMMDDFIFGEPKQIQQQ